jgi:hypothetical protein
MHDSPSNISGCHGSIVITGDTTGDFHYSPHPIG